jgi:electron transport complex protein RnfA
MAEIFVMMLTAVLIENFIFYKFMGCCPFLGVSDKPSTALGMGCAVIFVMTLSSAVTYAVYEHILKPFDLTYLKTVAFILVIAALVQFIEMFLQRFVPALYGALGIFLPLITTNCAVLAVVLVNAQKEYNLLLSVINGCASGLGFALAIVLFASMRERVDKATPPECFKGAPISLIAAGLMALAFMGFSGMRFS